MNITELKLIQGGMILYPFRNIFTKIVTNVYKLIKLITR